jgi:hypothetical protein
MRLEELLAGKLLMAQVTGLVVVAVGVAVIKVRPVGKLSVMVMPVAVDGPALVIVSV